MRDNCVIFSTPERQELRVVFDPDGTPFFCGPDLAAIAGYEQPRKAVTGGNKGVNRIDSVLRKVPWDNGMRKGRCEFTCFSAENAVKLLCRRPAPYAAIRWLEDEVIPKTQEMGEEVARAYPGWNKPPQQKEKQEQDVTIVEVHPKRFLEQVPADGGSLIETGQYHLGMRFAEEGNQQGKVRNLYGLRKRSLFCCHRKGRML